MINDLALKSPLKANHWKYVDDMSLSEVLNIDTPSRLQSDLDQISNWFTSNNPRANGAKRRSGRKPGARVTNFVLAELKVVARDR